MNRSSLIRLNLLYIRSEIYWRYLFTDQNSCFEFQVPIDELNQAAQLLCEALYIRAKYMALSLQSYNATTARSLQTVNDEYKLENFYNQLSEDHLESPRGKKVNSKKIFLREKLALHSYLFTKTPKLISFEFSFQEVWKKYSQILSLLILS